MKRFLSLQLLLLLLFPSPSQPAGPKWTQPTSSVEIAQSTATQAMVAGFLPGDKSQLFVDAERFSVVDGEVRDISLKKDLAVSRASFFERYKLSLGLGKDDEMKESKSFKYEIPTATEEKKEFVQSRFKQTYKGLEVLGAEYVLLGDVAVQYAIGKIATGLNLDVTPTVTEAQAFEVALNDIGAETYAWEAMPEEYSPPKGQLAIGSKDFKFTKESFRLVWRFVVSSAKPFESWTIDIDAKTGEVVNKFSNIVKLDVEGEGETLYNGKKTLTVDEFKPILSQEESTQYRLRRETKPSVKTLHGPQPIGKVEDFVNEDTYFDDQAHRLAVSVHWAVEQAISFYKKLGWVGWDGKGEVPIQSAIIPGKENNAWYSYDMKRMYFLDFSDETQGPSVSLDVVGHEFTHGVIKHLVPSWPYEREWGALNEGFANIMGFLIRNQVKGQPGNWCYEEDSYLKPNCTLHFKAPHITGHATIYKKGAYVPTDVPCNDENDWCGVHTNSGVLTHWFYLLAKGGKEFEEEVRKRVEGIGIDEASTIAFYTMFNLRHTSDFMEVRLLSLAAVESLFKDSPKYIDVMKDVTNAWHAVGVGPPYQQDRKCTPEGGSTNIEPWPAKFSCKVFPDESEWEFQISPNLNFDQEVKTFPPTAMGAGTAHTALAQANLKSNTDYFLRFRGKKSPQAGSAPQVKRQTGLLGGIGRSIKNFFTPTKTLERTKASGARQTITPEDWTDWSPPQAFKTASKAPGSISPKTTEKPIHPWQAKFSWNPVPAEKYYVQVGDPNFEEGILDKTVSGTTATFDLGVGTDYAWRVTSIGPEGVKGEDDWSYVGKFKTGVPQATLSFPGLNDSVHPWNLTLKWKLDEGGAVGYDVVVSKNKDLSAPVFKKGPGETKKSTEVTVSLAQNNGPYYWGVRPQGPTPYNNDKEGWATGNFTADYTKTKSQPVFPTAANNIPYKTWPMGFVWKNVPQATGYRLWISKKPTNEVAFNDVVSFEPSSLVKDSSGWSSKTPNSWPFSTNKGGYCWRVRAIGPSSLEGVDSDLACYNIAPPEPGQLLPSKGAVDVEYAPTLFKWDNPSQSEYPVDAYHLEVYQDPNNSLVFTPSELTGTQANVSLSPSKSYSWRVFAHDKKSGLSTGSQFRSFTTKAAPEQEQSSQQQGGQSSSQSCSDLGETVVTNLPPNSHASTCIGCVTVTPTPNIVFQWNPVSGAKSYQVEVTQTGGSGKPVSTTTAQGTQSSSIALQYWTGYIVNVYAVNGCGQPGSLQGKGIGFYLVPSY